MSSADPYPWPRWLVESPDLYDWERVTWSMLAYAQEHNEYVTTKMLANISQIDQSGIRVRLKKMQAKGVVIESGILGGTGQPMSWRAVVPDKYKKEEGSDEVTGGIRCPILTSTPGRAG